jgi:D-serine deaminase-like pyridoxal phosphate-dependent protein
MEETVEHASGPSLLPADRVQMLDDLATPAVLVDLAVLERNIARMADAARRHGIRLRPHAKTHKAPAIGRLQIAAGAVGLCVAKTSEAEVFATAGFDDLFVAFPVVGADKGRRLLALADRIRLAVGVDSVEGARTLGDVFAAASRRLDVLLEVDTGLHRVGVAPETVPEVARRLADLPGLRLRGLFTHAGHSYAGETPEAVAAVGADEGRTMARAAEAVRGLGIPLEEVSVGSTPSARHALAVAGVTECRPGNYVFHDASQVSLGTCGLEDCALTILATVVSVPAPDRAVVDAGSKTLSSDPLRPRIGGHGFVLGRASRLSRLSEEHGVIDVVPGESFRVGERVRILPNHACVVSNLHDRLLGVRDGRVETEIAVAARGRVQ